jgi:hypothetical protein
MAGEMIIKRVSEFLNNHSYLHPGVGGGMYKWGNKSRLARDFNIKVRVVLFFKIEQGMIIISAHLVREKKLRWWL